MIAEKIGFIKDDNISILKKVLKDGTKFKYMYIDIYSENPLNHPSYFMLLLRTHECNISVLNDGHRIIFSKNNKSKTHIVNILLSKINECFFKHSENYFEFIINIQNVYYKLIVFN
jgi:hypothetical protein